MLWEPEKHGTLVWEYLSVLGACEAWELSVGVSRSPESMGLKCGGLLRNIYEQVDSSRDHGILLVRWRGTY